jgi:excisionase family DNA binding protein
MPHPQPLRTPNPPPPRYVRPPPLQLLDLKTVASRLAIAPRTVRGYAADGKLPYVRIGRLLRFEEADVTWFINEHRV